MLKPTYQYRIHEGNYSVENSCYVGYGIVIRDAVSRRELLCIKDISLSKKKISALIKRCNRLRLSPLHIYEVIDDFLQA